MARRKNENELNNELNNEEISTLEKESKLDDVKPVIYTLSTHKDNFVSSTELPKVIDKVSIVKHTFNIDNQVRHTFECDLKSVSNIKNAQAFVDSAKYDAEKNQNGFLHYNKESQTFFTDYTKLKELRELLNNVKDVISENQKQYSEIKSAILSNPAISSDIEIQVANKSTNLAFPSNSEGFRKPDYRGLVVAATDDFIAIHTKILPKEARNNEQNFTEKKIADSDKSIKVYKYDLNELKDGIVLIKPSELFYGDGKVPFAKVEAAKEKFFEQKNENNETNYDLYTKAKASAIEAEKNGVDKAEAWKEFNNFKKQLDIVAAKSLVNEEISVVFLKPEGKNKTLGMTQPLDLVKAKELEYKNSRQQAA